MAGLNNKVVLITGASSGIGATTAVEFARYGTRLSLTGRKQEGLDKTVARCLDAGLNRDMIFLSIGDVTVQDDVTRIVESTVHHFGRLDVLVNIAGGLKTMRFHNCPVQKVTEFYHWNVVSQFMMNTAAMYHLIETKGNIVNIGSMSGIRPHHAKSWPLYPMKKLGKTLDVANAIVFLASDDAGFVTGYNMPVDGGMSLTAQTMM